MTIELTKKYKRISIYKDIDRESRLHLAFTFSKKGDIKIIRLMEEYFYNGEIEYARILASGLKAIKEYRKAK